MIACKTKLKCTGCKRDLPKEGYSTKTEKATWYGLYRNDQILEWVCVECWDGGVRYEKV